MRNIFLAIGAMFLCGTAWADGSMVRWDRIEGFGAADVSQIYVGPIEASRPRTVGSGRATVNLRTGFLSFVVKGLSNGNQYGNGPLGAPWGPESLMGTLVCDSTQRYAPATWVDSPPVAFDASGSGRFEGFVDVPEACRERPDEMVFLLRHADRPGNRFVAYGAGRTIQ